MEYFTRFKKEIGGGVPIEKTRLILRKLGLPEEDVQVLENFYKGSWFQVKGDTRSARVWLRRGMKQGDHHLRGTHSARYWER